MSENNLLDIGTRIRKSRESYNYTQEKFSEIIGISPTFLSGIECGSKGMSFNTLEKVCKSLHLSSDFILFGKIDNHFSDEAKDIILNMDEKYVPTLINIMKTFVKGIDDL